MRGRPRCVTVTGSGPPAGKTLVTINGRSPLRFSKSPTGAPPLQTGRHQVCDVVSSKGDDRLFQSSKVFGVPRNEPQHAAFCHRPKRVSPADSAGNHRPIVAELDAVSIGGAPGDDDVGAWAEQPRRDIKLRDLRHGRTGWQSKRCQ